MKIGKTAGQLQAEAERLRKNMEATLEGTGTVYRKTSVPDNAMGIQDTLAAVKTLRNIPCSITMQDAGGTDTGTKIRLERITEVDVYYLFVDNDRDIRKGDIFESLGHRFTIGDIEPPTTHQPLKRYHITLVR